MIRTGASALIALQAAGMNGAAYKAYSHVTSPGGDSLRGGLDWSVDALVDALIVEDVSGVGMFFTVEYVELEVMGGGGIDTTAEAFRRTGMFGTATSCALDRTLDSVGSVVAAGIGFCGAFPLALLATLDISLSAGRGKPPPFATAAQDVISHATFRCDCRCMNE